MSDWRLAVLRHGRVLAPLVGASCILVVVRLFSDHLAAKQVHGIGVMLLMVAMTVYALDYVIGVIGLGNDRLLLLSPTSRFRTLLMSCTVMSGYLVAGYVVTSIPAWHETTRGWPSVLLEGAGYLTSLFVGFGMVSALTYSAKFVRGRGAMRIVCWAAVTALQAVLSGMCAVMLVRHFGVESWIIGAGSDADVVNVFSGLIPISALGVHDPERLCWPFIATNIVFGIVLWTAARFQAGRGVNYIEL